MEINHGYSKFMSDIIDSGAWAKLSAAARALYPVLLRFSDGQFKHVWPGTEKLLLLTGFKTKKSLQSARKELAEAGFIDYMPGTGRTSSRYYFRFEYPGSKISSPRGLAQSPSGDYNDTPLGDGRASPNQIHININQNIDSDNQFLSKIEKLLQQFLDKQPENEQVTKSQIVQSVMNKYGELEVGEAIQIAIERGKNGDIRYLEGILKNRFKDRLIKNNPATSGQGASSVRVLNDIRKVLNDKDWNVFTGSKFHYKYENIYYFKCNKGFPHKYFSELFKEKEITVKFLIEESGDSLLTHSEFQMKRVR